MENEAFLQAQQTQMTDILRPYQREVNRRQRLAEFVNRCIRAAGRDDFFQLYELLHSRGAEDVANEAELAEIRGVFAELRQDAIHKVERSQLSFMEDFTRLVQEAGLPLEGTFPRLSLLKGIDLEVNFPEKTTLINGKAVKTVDPQRLLRLALQLKRRLYDRPFDPQGFIDGLFAAYDKVVKADGQQVGASAPTQAVYLEYTLSLQPRSFFQDMAKGRFREYDADQFP